MNYFEILNNLGIGIDTILENINEGIFVLDADGKFIYVNKAIEERSGITFDQFRSLHYLDLVPPQHKDIVRSAFTLALAGDSSVTNEFQYVTAGGETRSLEISTRLISAGGRPPVMLVIARNITERKKAEDAYRQSEQRYRSLVENLIIGLFVCEVATGRFVFLNDRTCEMFGYTMEEGLRTSIWDAVHGESHELIKNRILQKMKGEMPNSQAHIYTCIRKNGERFSAEVSAYAVIYEGNTAIQGTVRDVSETESLQNQLIQAQKMKAVGTLAGGVAHDFNNLLMGIQGNASLMLMDLPPDHPHHQMAKNIQGMVKSGAELTRQLLGFARGGKYEIRPKNINDILAKSASLFGRTHKEITIITEFVKEPWTVEVDRGQIEQVVLNLLVNAWQAMPAGGNITLGSGKTVLDATTALAGLPPGRYVTFTVGDTGTGMDADTMARIFDPFFTTKEMGRGIGLGLTSAYGIIKNHSGVIDVRSEKGRGTVFTIYLPASDAKAVAADEKSGAAPGGVESVLVIDDEESVLEVTAKMLMTLGYRVMTARSGADALEIVSENRGKIDLIILDMILPGTSSEALFDGIRSLDPQPAVLLSSGYSIEGQAEKIIARGCQGFIQKPFGMDELSSRIRSILDEGREKQNRAGETQ